jgi:hypothetical protein
VNVHGESTTVIKVIPNQVGSITPGDGSVMREDAYDAQSQSIKIITTFRLRGVSRGPSAKDFKPDRISWNGSLFELTSQNEYTDFGYGFVESVATEIDWVDLPPQYRPGNVGQLDFSRVANGVLAHGAGGVG